MMEDSMKCKWTESCGYDICIPEYCPEYEAVKITNADRIRAMSDGELAEYLYQFTSIDCSIPFCKNLPQCDKLLVSEDGVPEEMCVGCLCDWIRQSAEEG